MPAPEWIKAKIAENRTAVIHVFLVLLVVLASYGNALHNGFVTDDFGLAVNNPNAKSWDRLGRILTSGYWDAEGGSGGLYRPVTILSFLVEYTFAGLSPVLHHLDNVILHFLCSVLAYLLLRRIYEDTRAPFFAALLFAAHPVHVEAVTWVSGRSELLCAFFGLLSMLVFVRRPGDGRNAALYATLYFFAMFSKESAVVVPALLVVYMLLFEDPGTGKAGPGHIARRIWPYVAVTAAFVAAKFYVLGRLGPQLREQALYGVGFCDRVLTMSRALYEYIRLGFLPTGLGVDYLFPPPSSEFDPRVQFSLLAVFAAVAFAPVLIKNSRPAFFAVSWFFIALFPVSNIMPTGIIMSDRALYLPSLGVCMILGAALAYAASMFKGRDGRMRAYGTVLLLPVLGSFMTGTVIRNPVWQSQQSLAQSHIRQLQASIERYPEYARAYRELARILIRFRGYGPETEKAIKDAFGIIGPDDAEIRQMLAYSYLNRSMLEEALFEIMVVINKYPVCAGDYYFAAKVLAGMNNYGGAMDMAGNALRLNPDRVEYLTFRADMLMKLGDDESAFGYYDRITALDPENYDAFLRKGIILDSHRRFGPAIENITRAVELRPDIPDLHYFLAIAYLDAGMTGQAMGELDRAVALKPDYTEAVELRKRLGPPG